MNKLKKVNIQKRVVRIFLITTVFFLLSGCYKKSDFEILFSNNYEDIYRISSDEQYSIEQLTFTPLFGEYYLRVLDNGENIYFYVSSFETQNESVETSEMHRHIYLLNTENKQLDDITNFFTDFDYIWEPHTIDWSDAQKQFVVIRYDGSEYDIKSYLDIIDSQGVRKQHVFIPTIGDTPATVDDAVWAPDGEKLLLSQQVIGVAQAKYPGSLLFVYKISDGSIVQITNYEDNCYLSSWSPTSQQIVTTCEYISSNRTLNSAGEKTVRILSAENNESLYEYIGFSPCEYPSWSPDGEQISFVCKKKNGEEGIFVVNADGSKFHEIDIENFDDFLFFHGPHWSPDGTKIIYVAFLSNYDASHGKIYSVNIDGSDNHAITAEEGQYIIEAIYPVN